MAVGAVITTGSGAQSPAAPGRAVVGGNESQSQPVTVVTRLLVLLKEEKYHQIRMKLKRAIFYVILPFSYIPLIKLLRHAFGTNYNTGGQRGGDGWVEPVS